VALVRTDVSEELSDSFIRVTRNAGLLIGEVYPNSYSASNSNLYQGQKYNMFVSRARPVRKTGNLTAICEPIVYTSWDPQHLTIL
jgi:hypothetical protein